MGIYILNFKLKINNKRNTFGFCDVENITLRFSRMWSHVFFLLIYQRFDGICCLNLQGRTTLYILVAGYAEIRVWHRFLETTTTKTTTIVIILIVTIYISIYEHFVISESETALSDNVQLNIISRTKYFKQKNVTIGSYFLRYKVECCNTTRYFSPANKSPFV
jgi:hypothetical protein